MMEGNELEKYSGHYSEDQFWTKVANFARKAGMEVIYGVLLLYYVLTSDTTRKQDKAKIIGALGYFILPLDLIPDGMPIVGYTDDLAAISWCIYSVAKNITPAVRENATRQMHKWFGDFEESEIESFFRQNP